MALAAAVCAGRSVGLIRSFIGSSFASFASFPAMALVILLVVLFCFVLVLGGRAHRLLVRLLARLGLVVLPWLSGYFYIADLGQFLEVGSILEIQLLKLWVDTFNEVLAQYCLP